MENLKRIKELTEKLHKASVAYYQYDNPIYTDKQYDDMYDELKELEQETGIVLAGSPTQKVQGYLLKGLEKQKHSKPMLSAAKTKDTKEIESFVNGKDFYCSYKLDGCFSGETRIKMSDGTNKMIKDVKVGDYVMSFDENTQVVSKKRVLNVFYNGKREFHDWVRLKLFSSERNNNSYRLLCTKNHKIFTNKGWVEANSINIGDTVYYYDYVLSEEQESFLLGIGLGDGWMLYRKKHKEIKNLEPKLECHYSKVDKNNYNILIDYANNLFSYNNPKITYRKSGYGSNMIDINLHSIKVPNYMYDKKNHLRCGLTFTQEICEKLNPLSLAILYLDDGSKCPSVEDGYEHTFNKKVRCHIATNRHKLEDVKRFSNVLNDLGYTNTIQFEKEVVSKEGDGYRIALTVDGTEKFFDDIAKYIPKELREIKLGLKDKWQNCEEYKWWKQTGEYGLHDNGIVVQKEIGFRNKQENKIRVNRKSYLDSYDLEIEDNHTYFANNYAVHNCTLVTIFENGELKTALTRGSGEEGEIVTEAAKMISNLPQKINYKDRLELRGECVVSWSSFNYINERLEDPFSHPRNMAAGSIRNLDTNVARNRMLEFIVFECVTDIGIDNKWDVLVRLDELGFTTVPRCIETVENCVKVMQPEFTDYPCDGLIFEINSRKLSGTLGVTSHHECCRIALKHKDETYETTFRDIEWNTTRSGVINPTAIFDTVNIQGSDVSRATLHNLSYIEELELGEGDVIEIYKSNMIIPKVHDNLTRSNTWTYPKYCPCCDHPTEIHNENGSKSLHCTNSDCSAKFISKLTNFVSKNGINVMGLSENILETLVDKKYITSFIDLYHLDKYKAELSSLQGFGAKSVAKLLQSIENSRKATLDKFLTALSIPLCGKATCKDISKYCHDSVDEFISIMENNPITFSAIDGIGEAATSSLSNWWIENKEMFYGLLDELDLSVKENVENIKSSNILNGATFCITGKLEHFSNRDAMVDSIIAHGGQYLSGVSSKLNYLVNNDKTSTSGKNKKALDIGTVQIISETDYLQMISE